MLLAQDFKGSYVVLNILALLKDVLEIICWNKCLGWHLAQNVCNMILCFKSSRPIATLEALWFGLLSAHFCHRKTPRVLKIHNKCQT